MKKLFVLIAVFFALTGCTALELADMVFDDNCLYRGTVESVEHTEDQTIVIFDDSTKEYTCNRAEWVDRGDWIEVRKTEFGCEYSH